MHEPRDAVRRVGAAVVELPHHEEPRGDLRHVAEEPRRQPVAQRRLPLVAALRAGDLLRPPAKGHGDGDEHRDGQQLRAAADAQRHGDEELHDPSRKEVLDPAGRRAAQPQLALVEVAQQRRVEEVEDGRQREEARHQDGEREVPRRQVLRHEVPPGLRVGLVAEAEVEGRLVDGHLQLDAPDGEGHDHQNRMKKRHRQVPASQKPRGDVLLGRGYRQGHRKRSRRRRFRRGFAAYQA